MAKNHGLRYFNVDCTYKPYSPYIHLNPDFNGIYGDDFNDARGLICGGDFSISSISDKFETYELQNKNYENIFNRQIQNMDVNNALALKEAKWNVATGTLTGLMSGATAGGMVGGVGGAVAGGVVGAGASLAGGLADISILKQRQQETKSYAEDMYGFQLGNVQALPYGLTKVSAFNLNNKVFPILEYYSCTDREKQALRDKMTYNGMTVMAIGKIVDYLQDTPSFISATLIRTDIEEDYHLVTVVNEELTQGVYM